jgi:transcriptional regulatory protein LevR
MTDFEQNLIPFAEYLGIPAIILTPLIGILYIIFKYVLPKILNNNSRLVGRIVIDIVAQLFGEGGSDSVIDGIEELSASKVIKELPQFMTNSLDKINIDISSTVELIVLLSKAMMDERFIKPGSDTILREIVKKGDALLSIIAKHRLEAEQQQLAFDNETGVLSNDKEDIK